MAAFVPILPKKLAKPVNAQAALTLCCRRRQVIDELGVPESPGKHKEHASLGRSHIFADNNELSVSFLP